jgi:hypothetical protein
MYVAVLFNALCLIHIYIQNSYTNFVHKVPRLIYYLGLANYIIFTDIYYVSNLCKQVI